MSSTEQRKQKLVADVLLLAEGRVLLVRYNDVAKYDGEEGWFLPDDYIAYGEHPGDAAKRILREQAGLELGRPGIGFIESFGGGGGSAWHLIFHHKLELERIPDTAPGTNVKEAAWFELDNLPERSTMAHEGWGLDVMKELMSPSGVS